LKAEKWRGHCGRANAAGRAKGLYFAGKVAAVNRVASDSSSRDDSLAADPRWALVQRVESGATFEKSKRLRDFLLYVSERALREPGRPITEQEIRRDVFGRSTDVDAMEDTVVRVQASHLRRRLEQYFAVEGAAEPLVIEVPRGAYAPVFRERPVTAPAVPATPAPAPVAESLPPPSWRPKGSWLLVSLLSIACAVLAVDAFRWRTRAQHVAAEALGPNVDRLWRQMFGSAPVYVVLGDSNLALFQDTLKYQMTLPEYQRQQFVRMAGERLPKDEVPVSWRLMNREYTSIGDANLAQRVSRVNALQGRAVDVVLARRADPGQLQAHNVILSGPRRSNPWVELFEGRLNFQSRFEEGTRRAWLQNAAPQPGEAAEYAVEWNKVGYGRVAYLPSLQGGASVLLLSGIDMSSTDACSDFVSNESRLAPFLQTLGTDAAGRIPHFEVLLRTNLLLGTTSAYEVVAYRHVGDKQS
jgi:hypothetical protein